MSRGRGTLKDNFFRPPPTHYQAKVCYNQAETIAPFPRHPQPPFPNYHNNPARTLQPSSPSLLSSAPPFSQVGPHHPDHYQNHSPGTSSFHYLQIQFLRGQTSEAPQFRGTYLRGGSSANSGRSAGSSYSRFPNPNRGRGFYNQDPSYARPRNSSSPRHLNKSNYHHYNRQWGHRAGELFDNFQRLSLQHNNTVTGGDKGSKVTISLTPDIQECVHRSLAALGPDEKIPAKLLARKLHLPKKIVNKALYSLESLKKASKQGLHPPEWTLYKEPVHGGNISTATVKHPQEPEAKVELEAKAIDFNEEGPEDSDKESSSSDSSYFEWSDSEDSTSSPEDPKKDQQNSPVSCSNSKSPAMATQKEQLLQYLLHAGESTSIMVAKNLGLQSSKQINPTLYALEKQGEVVRNTDVKPPTWQLSTHRKERMQRNIKASQSNPEDAGSGLDFQGSLTPSWILEKSHSELAQAAAQPSPSPAGHVEEASEGQWATDDIPEFLNAIRKETDATRMKMNEDNAIGTVAVSLAAPPPQNLWAKLQEVRLKNPVSGLMEYAQYLGHNCEFILLDQMGPSHDPRFRMQVLLNRRTFPVAEASSKKVAKKDAAAATLRVLMGEMQSSSGAGEDGNMANADGAMDILPDASGPGESGGGIFGPGNVEGMETGEETKPPLSRSLPGGKNPVSVLMEYSQRSGNAIEFIITGQAGPPHDPRFMYRVKVGESLFAEASAPSKKAARQLAAEEAVKELMADGRLQLNKPQLPLGTSDGDGSGTNCPSLPPLTADELRAAHEAGVGDLINHLNNNAVSGLLEYARARGFAAEIRLVGQSGPAHEPKFTYQAKLGGRWFPPVCASNKKQGKQEAADAALRVLIGEAEKAARTGELIPAELPVSGSTLHDQIAMLSHQRFNALTTRIQHSLLGRKILATIVMRRGEGLGTVVSLGTGNRCVKGEELSLKGETVNDCHAEIISRRGFVRFLYSELLKHYEASEESIFEQAENNKLRIKSDITFHLYISTAPCGDGALFDKSCSESGDTLDGHQPLFENTKQGKLRTKVENGEGTIPVESSAIVPTWDGIQHGERLRTMSCSDKILRWNVLGLQGALLTHFLHPIYLKSITLGYLYSHGHLTRAVCCRLARDGSAFSQSLPAPFMLNHPEVGRVSVYDSTRHTGKTKESSVNWCLPDQHSVEVLDGTKGKLDGNKLAVSRVSKSNLFHLFRCLCQRCGRSDLLSLPSYAQAKLSAASFQLAKQHFFQALGVHGYGAWISKPLEEKSFEELVTSDSRLPVGFSGNGSAVEIKQEEM
ncbi:double-stranded RNA-specific adenosine deaminase [Synchiropus splendidus]|uniref:double-stranded RNA-specific adenosine deaminase n=1 Tax=Synchiropus splendidus TaxID=270530 RepID=UPI00237DCECC|nr:double-stranded RNA-specific adenosine deaminase [Synchiropus splendidus]XP_053699555.1 double-stranded RNA-specific adenosine deaminase [Synchiropus splendidus]XP_053699556.1 double-stranded RNA-specific adenosine deaminase [Synchiropus splendidus]XP_053699557.1 double-stranded RNA-specific adenosine deaminase [Synchiropus splendidus]